MAASIGLIGVRILIFGLLSVSYFMSNLDPVSGRLYGLFKTCISDPVPWHMSLEYQRQNVATCD